MQCKVLRFYPATAAQIETEINRWLAQGWNIASTTCRNSEIFVFLTK
ncbi:MAG: hypothetical protein IJ977_05605 [Fibrobacter sp.]|nr:hypothetical protein [Fibrobacter sp.]MBR7178693.1 hypothetical protein [Oscillospiraceae bacterium]